MLSCSPCFQHPTQGLDQANLDYIFTFLWSMTPIGELRLAIPLGIEGYGLPWYGVLPAAVLGNLVPAAFWLLALPRLATFLERFPNPGTAFLRWRSEALRRHHAERFHKHGAAMLTLFVAVPLPITGVWTGSIAAWTFAIPFRQAFPAMAAGVMIGGIIVTALTIAGISLI